MPQITFYKHDPIPLEMHKVRIVQKLNLLPTDERLQKIKDSGYNTFQLHNSDIFLDMLTDSGVNAMSDDMESAMLRADDAYAGSESYFRMEKKLQELFGIQYCLPAHQGRACENILATRFVKPGSCVIMNYHFTTAKAHITRVGGRVEELVKDEGLISKSNLPFKGNIDLEKLDACIRKETPENIPFVRLEAGTNLIGGQPISYENMKAATDICRKYGILAVLDASLLQDNLYFMKTREEGMADKTVREITRMVADLFDIIYFSARKFGFARGGVILVRDRELYYSMEDLIPMFEGFLTYGGMSVREIEAMTVGFDETMDMNIISQGPQFVGYCVKALDDYGVPVITPGGGLGGPPGRRRVRQAHPPGAVPRRGAGVRAVHLRRHPGHGAGHPLRGAQRRRQRADGLYGAGPPGLPPQGVHPVPDGVRHRPGQVALRPPASDRRPAVRP